LEKKIKLKRLTSEVTLFLTLPVEFQTLLTDLLRSLIQFGLKHCLLVS
jgi:hypothetical protein